MQTAHSPGYQQRDIRKSEEDRIANAKAAERHGKQMADNICRHEQLTGLRQRLSWELRRAEYYTFSECMSTSIRPHLKLATDLLDEIESLENGAPL